MIVLVALGSEEIELLGLGLADLVPRVVRLEIVREGLRELSGLLEGLVLEGWLVVWLWMWLWLVMCLKIG